MKWIIEAFKTLFNFIAYLIAIKFRNRNYRVDADSIRTKRVIKNNGLSHFTVFIADIICYVLICNSYRQHVVTYVGLMTMCMYTFSEQNNLYKEISEQFNDKVTLMVRGEPKENVHCIPNFVYAVLSFALFLLLFFAVVLEVTVGYYALDGLYICFISLVIFVTVFVKAKYAFLDSCLIEECWYMKNKEEGVV